MKKQCWLLMVLFLMALSQFGYGITYQVVTGNDDAYQPFEGGTVTANATALWFNSESTSNGSYHTHIGIRFQSIQIPRYATVSRAYIQFTAKTSHNATWLGDVVIYGHQTGNSSGFTTAGDPSGLNDISDRPKTSMSVNYNMAAQVWIANTTVNTPDVTNIVNYLLSRTDWGPGNSMCFIFEGGRYGLRHVYSADYSDGSLAPKLIIEWAGAPPTPTYDLTTNVTGSGSVTLNPPGGTYDENTPVTLTANPGTNYRFDHWDGDASGMSSSIQITMDADKTVTANFIAQYTLNASVNNATRGYVTLDPAGGTYDAGATVTVTAHANTGYQFDNWIGASGTSTTVSILMDSPKSVTANFSETPVTQYTLNASVNGSGGTVSGGGIYDAGATVTLQAFPSAGYQFDNWSGAYSGVENPHTFYINSNMNIVATFIDVSVVQHTLTINVIGAGTVTPMGGAYPEMEMVLLTATPDPGYVFGGWSTNVLSGNYVLMDSDKTVTATFNIIGTASWSQYTDGTGIYFDGNVRIGELYPAGEGGAMQSYGRYLLFSGGLAGSTWNSDNTDPLWIARYNVAPNESELRMCIGDDDSEVDRFAIGRTMGSTWDEKFCVRMDGYVGIGTIDPEYELDVVGTIRAHKVLVNTDKTSDFVFAPDYVLPSLEQVEFFIQENRHLPDIPSEKEVQENGVYLEEMQTKHLQKIEELTLYIIEQNKMIQELRERVETLENKQ